MATVNGLGRLVPTRALNKTMLHRAAGGLEDPYLNRTLYLYNEPSTVTVTVTVSTRGSRARRARVRLQWNGFCMIGILTGSENYRIDCMQNSEF